MSHSLSSEHHGAWHASVSEWPFVSIADATDHGQLARLTAKLHRRWISPSNFRIEVHYASMPYVLYARADASRQSSWPVHVSSWTYLLLFSVPIDCYMLLLCGLLYSFRFRHIKKVGNFLLGVERMP